MMANINSFGCRLNHSESDLITGGLAKKGYSIDGEGQKDDLSVINTCTVTSRSEMNCRQQIRSFQRSKTEEMHEDTYDKLKAMPVNYFHVFPYSQRAGIRSASMPVNNSAEDIRRRATEFRQLSDRKWRAFHQSYVGRILDVLVEEKDGLDGIRGYNGNYIRYYIRYLIREATVKQGKICSCLITGADENCSETRLEGVPNISGLTASGKFSVDAKQATISV